MLTRVLRRQGGGAGRRRRWIPNLTSTTVDNFLTLLIQFSSIVFQFLVNLVLARRLGPGGFGSYSYAVAWLLTLTVLATLGTQRLLVREIPHYIATESIAHLRGLVRRSRRAVALASLTLVGLAILVIRMLPNQIPFADTLVPALLILPLLSLLYVHQATLQGLQHVILGQLSLYVVRPAVLLSLVLILPLLPFFSVTPAAALMLYGISVAVAWGASARSSRVKLQSYAGNSAAIYGTSSWAWLKGSLPLLINSFLLMTQQRLDILILGPLSNPRQVGLYTVAAQMSFFVSFGFGAIAIPLAPRLARMYSREEMAGAQQLSTRATLWGLGLALPPAIIFVVFGRVLLRIFGPAFPEAYVPLLILVLAGLFHVASGPVGYLLLMGRLERYNMYVGVITSALHVALLLLLIPVLRLPGAALATALTIVLRNLLYTFFVYRRLDILTGPFLVLRSLQTHLRG